MEFMQTVAQGMGPEALAQFINPTEFLKRLAASSGIDVLNLIKDPATMEQETNTQKQDMMQASLMNQMGQLAKSPLGEKLVEQYANPQQQAQPVQQEPSPGA
jgi:hypothetical protein